MPDPEYLRQLAGQIDALARQGTETVIVTSGAIRAGLGRMALPHQPKSMALKQAAAAVGQSVLMQLYADAFAQFGMTVAQILLTRDDFHDRKRYVNASNTFRALLKLGIVPIVNENDTIATDEIKVGDNDTLGALVAGLVDADLLILLSDIDGLYDSDPNLSTDARIIRHVTSVDSQIEKASRGTKSDFGTGGMRTKVEAAKICLRSHIPMVIAHGRADGAIISAIRGEIGTRFDTEVVRTISARKRWIAAGQRPKGTVVVHDAAREQLISKGRSLLPAGVLQVHGDFEIGDLVLLVDSNARQFAQGIVNYDARLLNKIKCLRTSQVKAILGDDATDEVVHRDNMIVALKEADSFEGKLP